MNEPTLDADRVRFESMTRTDSGLDLKATDDPDNGVILAMATEMAHMLNEATNYVECEVWPNAGSDLKPMTMTIRYRSRPTPHELRRQAEVERDKIKAENELLLAVLDAAEALTGEPGEPGWPRLHAAVRAYRAATTGEAGQ